MELYMACLGEHSGTSTPCRNLVRDYLDCRMSKYVCPTVSRFLKICRWTGCLSKRFNGERRLEEPWASKSRQICRSCGECRQSDPTSDLRDANRQEIIIHHLIIANHQQLHQLVFFYGYLSGVNGRTLKRTLWGKGNERRTLPTFVLDAVPKQPEANTKFVCIIDSYGDMWFNIWPSNGYKRAS